MDKKTVKELKSLCKKKKLSGYSKLDKAGLVKLLKPKTSKAKPKTKPKTRRRVKFGSECPICLEEKGNLVKSFKCAHGACGPCTADWVRSRNNTIKGPNCPTCRASNKTWTRPVRSVRAPTQDWLMSRESIASRIQAYDPFEGRRRDEQQRRFAEQRRRLVERQEAQRRADIQSLQERRLLEGYSGLI